MSIKKSNRDIAIFILVILGIAGAMILAYLPRQVTSPPARRIVSLSAYLDPSGTKDLKEAAGAEHAPVNSHIYYHSRTTDAVWLRFTLPPMPKGNRYLHIANASLEDIRVYFPGSDPVRLGKKIPFSAIPIKTRLWNVPIPKDVQTGAMIHLRVRTDTNMYVPLALMSDDELLEFAVGDSMVFGIFFGLLVTIFFVNLFSWFVVHDMKFATYLAYLAFLITYHLRVHGFLWMLPIPFPVLEVLLWVSLGGFGIFMMRFAQRFLDLKDRLPVMHKVLNGASVLFGIQTLLGSFQLVFLANQIAYITGFMVPLTIIATTAWLYFRGLRHTRFYLLAWCFLFTGTLVWSTSAWLEAYIPSNYFFLVGTSIDTLLFTLAIFDIFKRELLEKDAHAERERYYQQLSHTDPLTGLYNRHYLNDLIHRLNSGDALPPDSAVIMLDIDNFKIINDTFGHLVGDLILTKLGGKIRANIRKSDIACRYGGDEFLIYLPGATERAALVIAETIKEAILTDFVYSDQGEAIHVTVSIGVTNNHKDDSFDGLFLRADAALYQAKRTGRNKIAVL